MIRHWVSNERLQNRLCTYIGISFCQSIRPSTSVYVRCFKLWVKKHKFPLLTFLSDIPVPKVLEENNQSNDSCYYLFEFAGKDFCPRKDVYIFSSGVSAGKRVGGGNASTVGIASAAVSASALMCASTVVNASAVVNVWAVLRHLLTFG